MKEFKVDYKRNYKLVDNGDLTQNLYSLTFQNGILINEFDYGNIADILICNKQQETNWKELKKSLNNKLKRYQKQFIQSTTDLEDRINYERCHICRNTLDKMEELESGNNE